MAAEVTYGRHLLGSRRMLDLTQLQDSFQLLLSQAHPDHVASFFYWLDFKVAQFKVFGGCISQGTYAATKIFCNCVMYRDVGLETCSWSRDRSRPLF